MSIWLDADHISFVFLNCSGPLAPSHRHRTWAFSVSRALGSNLQQQLIYRFERLRTIRSRWVLVMAVTVVSIGI